ncbi:cyclic GMP-AMP synthase [Electrophorus electricus]|uniref:cyclic GMP-AMP synthase n=1 Tax=Electrophorus electricus TaxID=8005 RepID=UPI0015D0720F|nr:cyclic GMP-AMP synthase [Electrophorus electricus]
MSGRGRPRKVPDEASGVSSAKNTGSTPKKSFRAEDHKVKKAGDDIPRHVEKRTDAQVTRPKHDSRTKKDATTRPSKYDDTRANEQTGKSARSAVEEDDHKSSTKGLDHGDGNPDKILHATLQKLRIKKQERSESTKCVNEIEDQIIDYIKKSLDWCKEIRVLKTGSHYENVKICEPDEFDVMLTIPVERVDVHNFGEDGAFYSVAMKRHTQKHPLDRFLNEDKTIKANEMLQEFRDKVKEVVGKIPYNIEVERKRKGCPAVTLVVNLNGKTISLDFVLGLEVHKSSWPSFTANGFRIEGWLGKKVKNELKRKPFYLVPKYEGRGNAEYNGVVAKDTWRISFSHVEKDIIKNHGASKTCCERGAAGCCRKQCLKLLKYLLLRLKEENPKEVSKFCSYHAKTTLLHACTARPTDSEWKTGQLSHCFQLLLQDFENHLRSQNIPNFFIPSHNLLNSAGLDKKSCEFLAKSTEYQRNNGFPLFR